MTLKLISIILLNYNGEKYIHQCIESVLKSEYDNFEMIIVDNNSKDKSVDNVKAKFKDPRIKIIRNSTNLGFAAGNNLGVKYARGEYIILLNIDTVVDRRWLSEMIPILEQDKTIGAAQPKLLSLDDKTIYDSAGDYVDFFGTLIKRGGEWNEKDQGQYDTIHDIFSARGAALATRKEIIESIGLFDESFFMSVEDIDFCWRVRLFGKRVVFVPKSIVYHKGRGITLQGPSIERTHNIAKNKYVCLIKNYETSNMIKYAILPLILEIFTGFFLLEPFILRRVDKIGRIKSECLAYYWIFTNLKKLKLDRDHIQKDIRRLPDSEIMKNMVKTSVWEMLILISNVTKFGLSRALMIYFKRGTRNSIKNDKAV